MQKEILTRDIDKDVTYSEWETTAYNGRIMDDSYVKITFYNPRNAISVMPNNRSESVLEIFSKELDGILKLKRGVKNVKIDVKKNTPFVLKI